MQDPSALDGAGGFAEHGDQLVVATRFGITIMNISVPGAPTVSGTFSSSAYLDGASDVSLSSDGAYAYVSVFNADRLTVMNVADPSNPTYEGSVASGGADGWLSGATDVAMSTSNANIVLVLASTSQRLTSVDVSTPSSPVLVGSVNGGASLQGARSLAVGDDGRVFIACASGRLTIVSVSDPTSPAVVSTLQDPALLGGASSVVVSGPYVYVAAADSNSVAVVDVSVSTSPQIVGSVTSAISVALTPSLGTVPVVSCNDTMLVVDTGSSSGAAGECSRLAWATAGSASSCSNPSA